MENELKQLKKEVEELKGRLDNLNSSTTIPLDVGEAFKKRLQPASVDISTKTVASASKQVNEGGSAVYNVTKPMTGFIKILVNGIARDVPYF